MKLLAAILTLLFSLLKANPALADPLSRTINFAYLLQGIDPIALKNSNYDLIIMDYSSDGSKDKILSRDTIEEIISGKLDRKVIAYLSIGEAEEYRYYFKPEWTKSSKHKSCKVVNVNKAPAWLEKGNPNYCNNFKTRFWLPEWQKIIYGRSIGNNKSYLDRIIDAGFQGVYLDIVDAYEYWLNKPQDNKRKSAAQDMAKFVQKISQHARIKRGKQDFIIIPQNASGIIDKLSKLNRKKYLDSINAIGAEDTFYFGKRQEDNSLNIQNETLSNLNNYILAGKKVLAIDYLTETEKINDFKSRSCFLGFIPQVAKRSLSDLSPQVLNGCK